MSDNIKSLTHRDEIHGDVFFDPLSVALLDTSTLQRLGRIYQLGYSHLVFRGATHTRLSHSMGALKMADKLVDGLYQNYRYNEDSLPPGAIKPNEFLPYPDKELEDRWKILKYLVRWASLLHDIGHIPLGHTLEDEFSNIYKKHDDLLSPRVPFLWNEISPGAPSEIKQILIKEKNYPSCFKGIKGEEVWGIVALICLYKDKHHPERRTFCDIIDESLKKEKKPGEEISPSHKAFIEKIKNILENYSQKRLFSPYMADIVGNTICADYLDYMQRDPSNTGLDVLKDDRIISRFFVGKEERYGYLRMALALVGSKGKPRLDVCTGVVELVRQRFRFAEIIYYHKAKASASAMFAKAFSLISPPIEYNKFRKTLCLNEVEEEYQKLLKPNKLEKRNELLEEFRQKYLPFSLLDVEIGDESLNLFLQFQAFNHIAQATQEKKPENQKKIRNCIRGISLLQAISQRQLYKVCFTLNSNTFANLSEGSKVEKAVEERIERTLNELRKDDDRRYQIEKNMSNINEWPEDSFILYIPPRKSQAKGIETFALDGAGIVTLEHHNAVKEKVLELNKDYKNLWRIIVFINPLYQRDVVNLSKSIDAFCRELWSRIDLRDDGKIHEIKSASWFHYIREEHRVAAKEYLSYLGEDTPNWDLFDNVIRMTINGEITVTSSEHVGRAYLVHKMLKGGIPLDISVDTIREEFSKYTNFEQTIREMEERLKARDARHQKPWEYHKQSIEEIANIFIKKAEEKMDEEKKEQKKTVDEKIESNELKTEDEEMTQKTLPQIEDDSKSYS